MLENTVTFYLFEISRNDTHTRNTDCVLSILMVAYCLQVPEIDSSSSEGETPAKFDSTVEFNNVSFSYPSRPDVPVSQPQFTSSISVYLSDVSGAHH